MGKYRLAANRLLLASGAAMLALSCPSYSVAQETVASDDEIVVTARRREESLLEVPITMNVVSGDQLSEEGIDRAEDLQYLVPGLSVVPFLGGANPSLRGVGTGENVSGTDTSVGVYLDEVFQGVTASAFSRMFDVERVEVLKGPQGTLYGRNVTAGALSVVSRAPTIGEYSGEGAVAYGTYEAFRADGALNIPLGERAALRVSATGGQSEGFVRNIDTGEYYNGEDYYGVRARLLIEPTSTLRIDAGVTYMDDNTPFAWEVLDTEPNFLGYGLVRTPSQFVYASDESLNANLRVDVDLSDSLRLRSITGYFDQSGVSGQYGPADIPDPALAASQRDATAYEQVSQEVQLQWQGARNSATLGVYYLDSEAFGQRQIDFNSFGLPNYQNPINIDTTTAWAIFGEGEVALSDRLSLVAGLRYGSEERSLNVSAGDPPGLTDPLTPLAGSDTFSATTGRLGLTYDVDEDTFLFATVSRGFKSGGLQPLPTGGIGAFQPEYLWAYEVGAKRSLANGGSLEFAVFDYAYSDLQIFQAVTLFDFQVVNAAEASILGADMNVRLRFADNWGVSFAATYLDSQYNDYAFQAFGGDTFDLDGFRLARSPEISLTGQIEYDGWRIFDQWEGSLRAEVNHRSEQFTKVDSPAAMDAALLTDVTLLNFAARLEPVGDAGWGVFLNARNLTDEKHYEFNFGGGIIGGVLAPGRTLEVGVSARF